MKVKVRGFLTLKKAMGREGHLELEVEKATPREVLEEMCHRFGRDFRDMIVDPGSGEINPHIRILVNGRQFLTVPDQLDNALKEGDELALFPPLAGG